MRAYALVPRSAPFHSRSLHRFHRAYSNGASDFESTADLSLQHLHRRQYVYEDQLSSRPTRLLKTAIKTYLPSEADSPTRSKESNWLPLGFQHAYCRPELSLDDLCDDGTDIKFLPGPGDIWKYRLWAGGSVTYHAKTPLVLDAQTPLLLLERASDTRIIGKPGEVSKVFVTIKRQFAAKSSSYTTEETVASIVGADHDDSASGLVSITETENICFLRDPPKSLKDERIIKPPSGPTITHTMIPTRTLLFQFSALTYNAHSIHIDRQFARDEYHAKDLVVHGPLTQVLMLEFLRRSLQRLYQSSSVTPMLKSVEYSNMQPLYVDQPLTLCCQPISRFAGMNATEVKTWTVWIQKGQDEDASLAVKATITVDSIPNSHRH